MPRGGRIYTSHPYALLFGLLALPFGSLLDRCLLGATFEGQRCVSGLEKKNEKVFGF